jgi:hypothetical protein
MALRLSVLSFSGSMLVLGAAAFADPPAAPAAAPQAATATESAVAQTTTSTGPSADLLRKARAAGFKTEVHNGSTLFCEETAEIGSHFKTKKCLNEDQVALTLERRQSTKDQLTNHTCTGCSGK